MPVRTKTKRSCVIVILFLLLTFQAHALENGLCRVPPMGWNHWSCLRGYVTVEIAKATADATRFAADQTAWTANREAMATERWLGAIRSGMAKKPVTVFDHRLDLRDVPVLDLRPISPELRP